MMDGNLVGQDLHLGVGRPADAPARLAAVQAVLDTLHAAMTAAWPGAAWEWMHGADTVPRTVEAIARRRAAHVPSPEGGSDDHYAPLGFLRADAGAWRLAFSVEVHATWRGDWHVAIEPRLRVVRLFGLITSHRLPGSRELDPATAMALSGVLRRIAQAHGQTASIVPGNPHWQRAELLVFP
jgi:hypothetical protein